MKHIYFVSNNMVSRANVIYPKETTFNEVREKTMLSFKGEELARNLVKNETLSKIDVIYSSPYFCAMNTGKYFAEAKGLDIVLDSRLGERVIGELGCNEYRFLKGMQEHDFDYKLSNGESLNDVKARMDAFLYDVVLSSDRNILVVTHNIALLSLLLKFCHKGYNLYDRLILDHHDEVIMDGVFHDMDIIEIVYDEGKFVGVRRIV